MTTSSITITILNFKKGMWCLHYSAISLTLFFLACPYMASFSKTSDFNLRRDHRKNFLWTSVDEKSLSQVMSRKKIQAVIG